MSRLVAQLSVDCMCDLRAPSTGLRWLPFALRRMSHEGIFGLEALCLLGVGTWLCGRSWVLTSIIRVGDLSSWKVKRHGEDGTWGSSAGTWDLVKASLSVEPGLTSPQDTELALAGLSRISLKRPEGRRQDPRERFLLL